MTTSPEAMRLMRFWLNEGWKFRKQRNNNISADPQAYISRVEDELKMLEDKDFIDYFLVVSDLIRYAKDAKIVVGPSRGSSGASVVCYLLRITEIDPIAFPHMMFSRFVDPTRKDLPDIDIDIEDERRWELWEYARQKYGDDHVGTIINFVGYKGKNSIDDVARAYRIPKWEADLVKDLVIFRSGGDSRADSTLADTFEMFPAAAEALERQPNLKYAMALEGNVRNLGIHAAGMVLSNKPIQETCAMYTKTTGGRQTQVIAYDKKDAEYLGLLKIDLLGLSTMGMIAIALQEIGVDIEDLYALPFDDPATLQIFKNIDVIGIFQFEGRSTRFICREVEPEHFGHLADINALSRPGPLFSGTKTNYVEVKHNRQQPLNLHPKVNEVTDWTYFQIIYQEQVLAIIREIGGFPMEDVHAIRRIISQKLGEAQFEKLFTKFEEGAFRLHGINSELALKIWRFLSTSATYSFVYAHAVGYTIIAYWCAWLKAHYPTAFYAAQLCKTGDERKRELLAHDAIRHGIKILPPDLQDSGITWGVGRRADRSVVAGFMQIPGIGRTTADRIVDWRNEFEPGDRTNLAWDDLQQIKGIGPKTVDKIKSFVAEDDPLWLNWTAQVMRCMRDALVPGNPWRIPIPTHDSDEIPRTGTHYGVVWCGIPRKKKFGDFIEDERARYGREIDDIKATMKDPHLSRRAMVECYDDGGEDVYVRVNRWKFPQYAEMLEDLKTDGTQVLVVEGMKREDFGVSIHAQEIWVLDLEPIGGMDA